MAQMAQCGPSPVQEINLCDVLDADFERCRGTTGQRRTTLSRLGVESSFSIIANRTVPSTQLSSTENLRYATSPVLRSIFGSPHGLSGWGALTRVGAAPVGRSPAGFSRLVPHRKCTGTFILRSHSGLCVGHCSDTLRPLWTTPWPGELQGGSLAKSFGVSCTNLRR